MASDHPTGVSTTSTSGENETISRQAMVSPIPLTIQKSLLTRAHGLLKSKPKGVEYQAQLSIQKAFDLLTDNEQLGKVLVSDDIT